jgi:hypothetical protein
MNYNSPSANFFFLSQSTNLSFDADRKFAVGENEHTAIIINKKLSIKKRNAGSIASVFRFGFHAVLGHKTR